MNSWYLNKFPNQHYNKCMATSKENWYADTEVSRVKESRGSFFLLGLEIKISLRRQTLISLHAWYYTIFFSTHDQSLVFIGFLATAVSKSSQLRGFMTKLKRFELLHLQNLCKNKIKFVRPFSSKSWIIFTGCLFIPAFLCKMSREKKTVQRSFMTANWLFMARWAP